MHGVEEPPFDFTPEADIRRRHEFIVKNLMTRDEVAELLGISPESVRSTLRLYGVSEVRGYPKVAVKAIKRLGQGHRSDLNKDSNDD